MRNCKLTVLGMAIIAMTAMAGPAAKADVLYSDGAVNGTYQAAPTNAISGGSQVEDSFNLSGASTVTGVTFGNYILPGDTELSVEWAIVGSEGSQTLVCGTCSGTASLTAGASFLNGSGWDVVDQSFTVPSLSLVGGTYWLELQGEVSSNGYHDQSWDVNGGPSGVWDSAYGDVTSSDCLLTVGATKCSNSFEILGSETSVPEPSTLALLGAGITVLGLLRRRRKAA